MIYYKKVKEDKEMRILFATTNPAKIKNIQTN